MEQTILDQELSNNENFSVMLIVLLSLHSLKNFKIVKPGGDPFFSISIMMLPDS